MLPLGLTCPRGLYYNKVMKLDKIAVASGNKDKIAEIKAIFKGVEIVSMEELGFTDDIEETGNSFKENAKIKAETIAKLYNIPALSDDSGLCVDALYGAPGIYSARFSGEGPAANRKLLLKRMEHVSDRRAHFESAVCLCFPNGKTYFGEGQNVRQNFAGRNRCKRLRLRLSVLFRRFEKVFRACGGRRKEQRFAPLPRAERFN